MRSFARSGAPIRRSATSRRSTPGSASPATRCMACRRSARSRRVSGCWAASAAMGSTPRRWAARCVARAIVEGDRDLADVLAVRAGLGRRRVRPRRAAGVRLVAPRARDGRRHAGAPPRRRDAGAPRRPRLGGCCAPRRRRRSSRPSRPQPVEPVVAAGRCNGRRAVIDCRDAGAGQSAAAHASRRCRAPRRHPPSPKAAGARPADAEASPAAARR